MSSNIFVVLGATGAQGKSVVEGLSTFNKSHPAAAVKIRGVSRDTNAQPAQNLLKEFPEVELVSANTSNREELERAFAGASHLFIVTTWANGESERVIGERINNAAKHAGIKYVWWSALPNVEEITNGALDVPHFTQKAQAEAHAKQIGLKVITVGVAFYYSNWIAFFRPQAAEDGVLQWFLPLKADTMLSAYAVEDTGLVVAATLENPDAYVGKYIPVCGDHATVQEYLDTIAALSGKKARLITVPYNDWAKAAGFPGAQEVANMLEYFNRHQYFAGADVELGRKVAPHLQTFKAWAEKNKQALTF